MTRFALPRLLAATAAVAIGLACVWALQVDSPAQAAAPASGSAVVATYGVGGVLNDPKLEIFDSAGIKLSENDNWDASLAPTFSQIGAFALPPGSRDSALVLSVPAGRGYTAQVSGIGNGTGEALIEVYELP